MVQSITPLPTAPTRGLSDDVFVPTADAFMAALPTFATQINQFAVDVAALASATSYSATSTTSLTVGTGSKSFTATTGQLFQVGQFVQIANTATPANYMFGQVTAYTSGSGAMTVNVTSTGGSGTFTAWTISLSAAGGALSLSGGTMTGKLLTVATATGNAGFNLPHGTAPTTPSNGDLWTTTGGIFAQINSVTVQFASLAGAETLTNKTFGNQTVFTHPASSTTGAVIIRDAAGDPGGGYLQWTNNARSTQYGYIRGVNGSFQFSGNIQPVTDNAASCGLVGSRWATVYAATGTINTSDERLKVWRGKLSPAELAAARRIASEIGAYQWRDAIEKKLADGTEARFHIGVRAQRVFSIMDEYWLDWRRYGWCCFDKWDAEYEADGETLIRPAGEMYAIRPDELSFFLIAAQEQRLLALEATASRS